MKQTTEFKGEIDSNTIIVGDSILPLSIINRKNRKLNNIAIGSKRVLHSITTGYIFGFFFFNFLFCIGG